MNGRGLCAWEKKRKIFDGIERCILSQKFVHISSKMEDTAWLRNEPKDREIHIAIQNRQRNRKTN